MSLLLLVVPRKTSTYLYNVPSLGSYDKGLRLQHTCISHDNFSFNHL